jgi:hypothetical protein
MQQQWSRPVGRDFFTQKIMKKQLTTEELLTQFLHFCRRHYAEHSSEILLGENAKKNPEFVITPIKRKNYEN